MTVLIHLSSDPRCFHTCCVWSFNRILETMGRAGGKLSQPHTDSPPPPTPLQKKANLQGISHTHTHTATNKIISNFKVMISCRIIRETVVLFNQNISKMWSRLMFSLPTLQPGFSASNLTKPHPPLLRFIDSLVLSGGGVKGAAASASAVAQTLRSFEKQLLVGPLPSLGCWLVGLTLNLRASWLLCCRMLLVNLHSGSLSSWSCDGSLNLSPVFVENQMEPWVRWWPEDLDDLTLNQPCDFLFIASLSGFCCPLI